MSELHYNELKIRILDLLDSAGELASDEVLTLMPEERDREGKLSEKAISMALLRYWRQGLIDRSKRGGRFQYSLTEKGQARREWLRKAK